MTQIPRRGRLAFFFALLLCQASMGQLSHPSAIRIRAMVDLAPGQNRDVYERFASFVKTYRREMLTRISESPHPKWELIVALRPDIRNGDGRTS